MASQITSSLPYIASPLSRCSKLTRILTSKIFLTLILMTATICAALYPCGLDSTTHLGVVAIIGVFTLCYVIYKRKNLVYEITLTQSIIQNAYNPGKYPWWNQIDEDNHIYLGAIPLENYDHPAQLSQLGIKNFVSLVNPFEFDSGIASQPIRYQECDNVLFIPTPDYSPPSLEDIAKAVDWINDKVRKGEGVYIHCKAGKGRSATIAAAYLSQRITGASKEGILKILKHRRDLVQMNASQREAFMRYYDTKS